MDFHMPSDPRLHFGLNGSQESSRRNSQNRRPFEDEDEALKFLSLEEKECILFFEETIGSLDDDSEPPGRGLSSGSSTSADGRSATPSPVPVPVSAAGAQRSLSPKEQDIIDLVLNQPVQSEPRDVPFSPPIPDFRSVSVNPESHFEIKAKRESRENFPPEFHLLAPPPAPPAPGEDGFSHSLYQPAGSIPTPVVIAQKIAEHKGGGSILTASSILSRRRSTESQSSPPESPVRQGPPTLAKPTRYPDNISFMLGNSKDYGKTIAKAAVNVNERRAKVLANLTGASHSPEPEESLARNAPNRSYSFQDPAPDKSRMEALSKLGLVHKRSLPGGQSRVVGSPAPQSTANPETSSGDVCDYGATPAPDFNSFGGKSKVVNPSVMLQNKMDASSHHVTASEARPAPVSQRSFDNGPPVDYNSYGGKTIIMNPSVGSQHHSSYESGPHSTTAARTEASHSDFGSSGAKTRAMTPAPASTAKMETSSESLAPHDNKARPAAAWAPPSHKAEPFPGDGSSAANLNSYGGKSKVVTPLHASGPKPEVAASSQRPTAAQPGVATRPHSYKVEPRAAEAPRPPRQEAAAHSSRGGGGAPPEARRRAVSKPSLFHQGVTVQFSGRGATDESRREALRKLGLLKNTP
ncbi:proline and serine-rich protein 2 [Anguilla rostrata]|uniref:proline and serine-rich protein 2 n=1 Tax=Anguilla rostrata TaxID=7938 RepID=UPI0030D354F9